VFSPIFSGFQGPPKVISGMGRTPIEPIESASRITELEARDSGLGETLLAPIQSLYVHVPFCAHKCDYCAFYSEASSGELINRYVAALVRELELVAKDLEPRTIFFGGGTPSLLNLRQWKQILGKLGQLDLLGAAECTV